MFASFCGAMGFAGWLVMLLIWAAFVTLVVWVIARLFPNRARGPEPAPAAVEDVEPRVPAKVD